jgi:Ni/Co efflux regulator RcnB
MTWLLLMRSRLVQAIAALAGIALAILAIRRDAANDALRKHKEADNENADRIRDNVERNLDDRMHDYNERGYRD